MKRFHPLLGQFLRYSLAKTSGSTVGFSDGTQAWRFFRRSGKTKSGLSSLAEVFPKFGENPRLRKSRSEGASLDRFVKQTLTA